MRQQAALGLRVASVFATLLIGLPLVNQFLPEVAATKIGGFTLTWFILGIGFYPITWALSFYFVRESDRLEERATLEAAMGEPIASRTNSGGHK